MAAPKVSVIIPFNNVEDYIEECLKSVSVQTLKDIEVILINDASNDKSRAIAQKFTDTDSRFKIIDLKERSGQGYARNRGIEQASGEYTGFVDSDDFIEPDMFEKLYNTAKSNDTDITMCLAAQYDDMNSCYTPSEYYSLTVLEKYGDRIFSAEETKNEILDINVSLWNKIYKSSYLKNTGEKFPEGFIYEDLPFFFGTYLPARRVNIVWKSLYNYRINRRNSTMMQFNNKILDRLPMVSLTCEKMKKMPYLDDMKQKIQGWIINDLFHRYILLKENYHREFFFAMKKIFQSLEIENPDDWYWKTVYHFQGYLLVINNSFEDFNQKLFKQYNDIHELENRLRSEITGGWDLERRMSALENLHGGQQEASQQKLQDLQTEISALKEENKILKSRIEKIKNFLTILKNNVLCRPELVSGADKQQMLHTLSPALSAGEGEQLKTICSQVQHDSLSIRGEIVSDSKVIEQMNFKLKSLYNDIKDLSFLMEDNRLHAEKNSRMQQNKADELNAEIQKLHTALENSLNSLKYELQNYTEACIKSSLSEQAAAAENAQKKSAEKISALELELVNHNFENELLIKSLNERYTALLEISRRENTSKIDAVQNRLDKIEARIKK